MVGIEFGEPESGSAGRRFRTLERLRTGMFSQLVVVPLFHRHRIITQVAADNVNIIKLLPPLISGPEEVDYFVQALDDVMADAQRGSGLTYEFGRTMARGALRRKSQRSVASASPVAAPALSASTALPASSRPASRHRRRRCGHRVRPRRRTGGPPRRLVGGHARRDRRQIPATSRRSPRSSPATGS